MASRRSICPDSAVLAGLRRPLPPGTRAEEGLSHAPYLQNQRDCGLALKRCLIFLSCTQWGSGTSHTSQTKGCLRGTEKGRGELALCGASWAELQHLPDPETGLTLQPTWSFAPWRPSPWLTTATPGTSDPQHGLVPLR